MNTSARLVAAAVVIVGALLVVAPQASASRSDITYGALIHGKSVGEVNLAAYAPPADATAPTQVLNGSLRITGKVRTRTIAANPAYLSRRQIVSARTIPDDFNFAFVQTGNVLLPVRRGYIVTDHPHWDFVLEPGRVWNQPGDHGYSRAAIPFALVQKHMNCTHYGVLTFLFKSGGAISHVAMQISSETCKYLKLDMWGMLDATYTPHAVANKAAVIAAYKKHLAQRLPTRPIAQLAHDYPGVDPSTLAIGKADSRTLYGLVVNGVNYVSACTTRYGNYPYCNVLPFPSYSTAKSALAGLAFMAIAEKHPDMPNLSVNAFAPLPGCKTASWHDVTLRDLLDMTTGHYDSDRYLADEDAATVVGFFSATTSGNKAHFSCTAYPRQAAPGTTWAYHTSDTFLLGVELTGYLRSLPGHAHADVFRDVVDARIYKPLDLSATAQVTRRTADRAALPFFGYGLQWQRDDIARLAQFISHDHGRIDGKQVLDPKLLAQALQRVPGKRGAVVKAFPNFRYQLGFWARNIAPLIGCAKPVWVPFMSGFGGISVVMYPNGVVYYNVSDSGSPAAFNWGVTAPLVNKISAMCN